jgi:endonuclease III-like uncharacterized protein
LNRVTLKIYFGKAYDMIKWYFRQQTLKVNDFSDEWHALIHGKHYIS